MKKIKAFIYIFTNSLLSTKYYKEILKTPFSFSIKYLFILSFVLAFISSAASTYIRVPILKDTLLQFKQSVIQVYPDDLEVYINEGNWSINKQEPFAIKTPQYLLETENNQTAQDETYQSMVPNNFIVFDTDGTINDFYEADTLMLLNEKNLLIKEESGYRTIVNEIDENQNVVITKESFIEDLKPIDSITNYLDYIFFFIFFVVLFIYFFIYRTFYLIFVAIILKLINIFIKPTLDFKEIYRVGLHSMTLPLILETMLISGNTSLSLNIDWFLLLNITIGTLVILSATKFDEA